MGPHTVRRTTSLRALAATASGIVLVALDFASVPAAFAETAVPVVQARPDTGSRIRRERAKIYIPADKPYAELTPEQRAKFRDAFTGLADADEPPYPARGLRPVAEELAFALADGPVGKGRLFLNVKVDEKGAPISVAVFETPNARTAREAAAVLMKTQFKPGLCGGKPCAAEFPFTARVSDE